MFNNNDRRGLSGVFSLFTRLSYNCYVWIGIGLFGLVGLGSIIVGVELI